MKLIILLASEGLGSVEDFTDLVYAHASSLELGGSSC